MNMADTDQKRGCIGICKCRVCGKTSPWRSDLEYSVAINDGVYRLRTAIWPGFLGRCRFCDSNQSQDVVAITDTIEEAIGKADPAPASSAPRPRRTSIIGGLNDLW